MQQTRKLVVRTIGLPASDLERLTALAAERTTYYLQVRYADVVRDAVREYLAKHAMPPKGTSSKRGKAGRR